MLTGRKRCNQSRQRPQGSVIFDGLTLTECKRELGNDNTKRLYRQGHQKHISLVTESDHEASSRLLFGSVGGIQLEIGRLISGYNDARSKAFNSQVVPPPPPLAVQSTAIRSASPVSTVYDASINTERDLRSRISIVGS